MKKKILFIFIVSFLFVGCGNKNDKIVENWQSAEDFGNIDENINIIPLYDWGIQSEDLLMDKYINLESENTYKTMTASIFKATWNYYADELYKINEWDSIEKRGDFKIYKTNVGNRAYGISITIYEANNIIEKTEVFLSEFLSEEDSCKYSVLTYYILSPFDSKTKINNDITRIFEEDNLLITRSSEVKNLFIESDFIADGVYIRFKYQRAQK